MPENDIRNRLRLFKYDRNACKAAINGEKIPHALGLPLTRHCVVRGIRYHHGFGEELRGTLPKFTRALNARSIMSNHIPVMDNDKEFPYCIWYPQAASEATYRELVCKYPKMAYHVGRACAVAGYLDLYRELDILPEVHIAEEARECENTAIYEDIMSRPVRYAVVDDYTRTVSETPRSGACLNADTAVCTTLENKQKFSIADDMDAEYVDEDEDGEPFYFVEHMGHKINTFNITEDTNIDVYDTQVRRATDSSLLDLLTSPLPFDLPIIDKDLLILMAAYYGDIDRYVRLRRPEPVSRETDCCIRGIYHNTMFACWWSKELERPSRASHISYRIDQAVSARMIMNNVLHRMQAPSRQHGDPYMIWYPSIAAESTYRKLFRLRASMATQVLRACIAGGYTDLFKEVLNNIEPDQAVVDAANRTGGYFEDLVEQRVAELDGNIKEVTFTNHWHRFSTRDLSKVGNRLCDLSARSMGADFDGLYEGSECNAETIEVFASLPENWRNYPRGESMYLNYKEWPLPSTVQTVPEGAAKEEDIEE